MSKLGRNDLCICGSGKKFKNCCLGKEVEVRKFPFSQYSSRELLKVLALLLTLPRNHGKNLRIEQAILDVLRNINKSTEDLNLTTLRKDLIHHYTPSIYEDPPEEFFTEILYKHSGNYLVFPGVASNGVGIVQRLLNVIRFLQILPMQFLEEVEPVINFMLYIHNRIALTLGYSPRLFEDEHSEPLFIPDDSFIATNKNLFSFTDDTISDLLNEFGISQEMFSHFVFDVHNGNLHFENPDDNPIFQRPFILLGNEYILVDPTAELFCLNDFILETAKKYSCFGDLLNLYREEGIAELQPVFGRMGWKNINFDFPQDESIPQLCLWSELLFKVDFGRLIYVVIMTETPRANVDLEKAVKEHSNELKLRAEKIGGFIKQKFEGHQLLFLHVIDKSRILSKIGLRLNEFKNLDFCLFFSHEVLILVTRKWKFDRLALWKYARSLDNFENTRKFAPGNTHYSKMNWYFDYQESFYHPDKETPTGIFFEFEIESEVRRSAIQLLDKIAIPYFSQGTISYVPCYRKEEYYPVYFSQDINQGIIVSCLLEYECAVWCRSSREHDFRGDVYINGILYWLHEMYPFIKEWIRQLGSDPVMIVVTLDKRLYEVGVAVKVEETGVVSFGSNIIPEERRIDLFIPLSIRSYLCTPGNRGEHLLLSFILDLIGDLQKQLNVGERLPKDVKERMFGEIMPNGPKKYINTLTDYRDPTLTPVDIDDSRTVPKADISYVLQHQVKGLNRKNGIGEILNPADQTSLLNELVLYHYQKIKEAASKYDGLTFLMFLMRRHEALLHDYAFNQVNYPVQQACMGHYYNVFEEFLETTKDRNQANLALRILIEWVACWTPIGEKLPSDDDSDMILAHMCQVLNYGALSDEINYKLREVEIKLLPSGRLGVDRTKNDSTYDAMTDKVFAGEAHGFGEKFHEYFENTKHSAKNPTYKTYVDKVERIFKVDWDIGIHDIFTMTLELVPELFKKGHSVVLISKKELSEMLIGLNYTTVEISGWLNILRFIRRIDIFKAPDGYKREEIYPWRYNRRISYLLKPLIFIEQNGEDHLLISTRHLYNAAQNLVSLFYDARLPLDKESTSIRRLLSERSAIKGKQFREQVLQFLTENTDLEVYKQEITIKRKGFFISETDKGDIDILAINHKRKIMYSIECKNTSQAKVAYEFYLEIIDYLGQQDKAGLIQKHVNRDLWLRDNKDQVLQKLKLAPVYNILSLVVSNHVLPTTFLRNVPIKTISFYELKQWGLPH